ncbi:hypothetical protein [Photorhabdus sp. MH8.4]
MPKLIYYVAVTIDGYIANKNNGLDWLYTLWISRCIATARERIPGSIGNYVTGVSECSQQRGNLKDNGYMSLCLGMM